MVIMSHGMRHAGSLSPLDLNLQLAYTLPQPNPTEPVGLVTKSGLEQASFQQAHSPMHTHQRPKLYAKKVIISTIGNESRLTILTQDDREIISTGHGASTPVTGLKSFKKCERPHHEVPLPVMEDVTRTMYDIYFFKGVEIMEEA
jgi:hypothetical protein